MEPRLSRRAALASATATLFAPMPALASAESIAALEEKLGGEIGLYAINVQTGNEFKHRADQRFAMCSTFKAPLAGLVLKDIAKGWRDASETISFQESDLVSYSPVVEARWKKGISYMSLYGLCDAIVRLSDNTAANLLLDIIGGPPGFTRRVQGMLGTKEMRLDRYELELNENLPGDPRDTTTPRGMAELLRRMLWDGAMPESAAQTLSAMMIDCETGTARLRAGLPGDLVAGDKTGTSTNGLFGDNAFVLGPDGKPLLMISCYVNAAGTVWKDGNAAHAEIGRLVAARLLG